ncbi:GGDEF domain-containing protein [Ancylobacter sp. 6x-1]|uniref:diguanylate cyclase n=1 Tax=Ancylobacter crimeensis TaxID=2579147 RepID=A0ABT0D6J5_9HYPH|nr:GGDEF domain-containing protein [Ancylobacter crimeensis]MCK0195575.1 GGDEF domain-containing protein [Ancylobacter crimeensis]
MILDPTALWPLVLLIACLLGATMILAWWLTPGEPALGIWTLAVFSITLGLTFVVARPLLPELVSILLGNGLLLAGYGMLWSGMRLFDGRPMRLGWALLPMLVWPIFCLVPPFSESVPLRYLAVSFFIVILLGLTLRQLWRNPAAALPARQVVRLLILGMVVIALLRLPLAGEVGSGDRIVLFTAPQFGWLPMFTLGVAIVMTFALVIMVRERAEMAFRSASVLDELTGLLNRRGFLQEAVRTFPAQGPVGVLMMDLDGFKQVNDRLGHASGDRVLIIFARVLRENLRQLDVPGRLGGEEFVALLPGMGLGDAGRAADRVRRAFLDTMQAELAELDPGGLLRAGRAQPMSVSIGVSATDRPAAGPDVPLEPLLQAMIALADRELYRAKDNGRNRVELAVFDPRRADSVA